MFLVFRYAASLDIPVEFKINSQQKTKPYVKKISATCGRKESRVYHGTGFIAGSCY